jgi:hypothetical protein
VDDFVVKYVDKQHVEHLRNALLRTYELTTDWTATVYSGMTLKWDYEKRTCDIPMPGYVSDVLSKFQHDSICNQVLILPPAPSSTGHYPP